MLEKCESSFDIDRYLISFIQNCVFFAELSKNISKIPTNKISTIGVCYDSQTDQMLMYFNPEYMLKRSNSEIAGLFTHEFYHISLGHLTTRFDSSLRKQKDFNIATDLAINSLIVQGKKTNNSTIKCTLPPGGFIPGCYPNKEDGSEYSKEERTKFSKKLHAIAKFKTLLSTDEYLRLLLQDKNENDSKIDKKSNSESDPNQQLVDDHSIWENVDQVKSERVEQKIRSMIKSAANIADSKMNGWGSIPSEIQQEIRKYISNNVDWKRVAKQFIANICRGDFSSSIKRINRKYPYIHPGISSSYCVKLLIAQDQSGSVDNEMLSIFVSQILSLSKKIEIDFLPFDCSASENDIITLKKGTKTSEIFLRKKNGGTNFDCVMNIFNDQKNQNRWDGLLIVTDGMATKPIPSKKKRGWVMLENQKLAFETDEIQIKIPLNDLSRK